MGISEADLAFIAALGELPQRVCDLGDQDLLCNNEAVFDSLGFIAPKRGKARDFWKALGRDYLSLDVVGEATRLDLNKESARPEWGLFDLVTNCGGTEHIINQVNCFTVMHDLTRVGGIMYHSLPVAGYAGHGFFTYNLKFFAALARANGYKIISSRLDISSTNTTFDRNEAAELATLLDKLSSIPDAGVRVAMRKTNGEPFALPLDIPASPPALFKGLSAKWLGWLGR